MEILIFWWIEHKIIVLKVQTFLLGLIGHWNKTKNKKEDYIDSHIVYNYKCINLT